MTADTSKKTHNHMETCTTHKMGRSGCRLCMPCGPCEGTHAVMLDLNPNSGMEDESGDKVPQYIVRPIV